MVGVGDSNSLAPTSILVYFQTLKIRPPPFTKKIFVFFRIFSYRPQNNAILCLKLMVIWLKLGEIMSEHKVLRKMYYWGLAVVLASFGLPALIQAIAELIQALPIN